MLYHARIGSWTYGWLCTDAFFVLSGALLAKSSCKFQGQNVADATWSYIKRRYMFFYKYFLGIFACYVIAESLYLKSPLRVVIHRLLVSVPELLFIDRVGLMFDDIFYVGGSWFLSIVLVSDWILFPLLIKYYKEMITIICPIIFLLLITHLYASCGSIKYESIPWLPFIRGFCEMAFGCFVWGIAERTKERTTNIGKGLMSVVNFVIYILFIGVLLSNDVAVEIQIVSILLFGMALAVSFGNNSFLPVIFARKPIFLGGGAWRCHSF